MRFGASLDTVRYASDEVKERCERFIRLEVRDQVGSEDEIEAELRGFT